MRMAWHSIENFLGLLGSQTGLRFKQPRSVPERNLERPNRFSRVAQWDSRPPQRAAGGNCIRP